MHRLNSLVVFVYERVDVPRLVVNDVAKFLVHRGALVLDFVQHSMQDDEVLQDVLFEDIDLVKHYVRVQHQVVRERER